MRPLRALFVEDVADDAELLLVELRRGGFDVTFERVDTPEAMTVALERSWDIIFCDYSMPRFSAPAALALARDKGLEVPFMIVSGTIGEEAAVDAMRTGVHDYILKSNLARLVPAVEREMHAVAEFARRAASVRELESLRSEALAVARSEGAHLAELAGRFARALETLWIAYQPIVDWRERAVFAFEALVRSSEPSLQLPMELLDAAERLGQLHELGRRIRDCVARSAPASPSGVLLFVNVHPADFNDPELFSSTSPFAAIASGVVLEVTERASLTSISGLSSKVATLRRLGFRIAIDDLGAGYAGLSSFAQLEPEFVKLDMSLVRDVDKSTRKRSVVRAMVRLCARELTIRVVGEGVETVEERDVLVADGCRLLQGHLFAEAGHGFPAPRW